MPIAKRVERLLKKLEANRWIEHREIMEWSCRRARYVEEGDYEFNPGTESVSPGTLISKPGETILLESEFTIPSHWQGEPFGLVFRAGGEGLLSINGVPYHGLDKNRSYIPLSRFAPGDTIQAGVELYHVPPLPEDGLNRQTEVTAAPLRFEEARLVMVNTETERLSFTVQVAWEAARCLQEGDRSRTRILHALKEAIAELDGSELGDAIFSDAERLSDIEQRIRRTLSAADGNTGTMHMVGQSHIDVAWLWPLKETVRKCSRTFSTVCTLMDEYPSYKYAQSQPQLYAYVKQYYPELFQQIKARIAEGRWELVGGMWVEPDLNIPSGESLVRQLLYGRAFYLEEFGKAPEVEWLPDTFGYCASLPQLLKKSGVKYFMTSKMNWNDTNVFPYDLFTWTGIDGTSILSFLNHGLNENTLPSDVHEHWSSFRQKEAHPEQMLLYGYGDGGGGVTREMLEYVERSGSLPGLPASQFSTAHEFFSRAAESAPFLPEWRGDMYLELHRGTYTTHARNKRWNRKAEALYREAEIWNVLGLASGSISGQDAVRNQHEALTRGWKLLLLNQFHDIIPGTSITEVYVKSEHQYKEVFECGESVLKRGFDRISTRIRTAGDGQPVVLFNSLSWDREDQVDIQGDRAIAEMAVYDGSGRELPSDYIESSDGKYTLRIDAGRIPAMGYKTVWLRSKAAEPSSDRVDATHSDSRQSASSERELAGGSWETARYKLTFDESGRIAAWTDKAAGRELIAPGKTANDLQLFHDQPTVWDAWDIDPEFNEKPAGEPELLEAQAVHCGRTVDILRFKWRVGQSIVEQDMYMYHQGLRIDFKTRVNWQETHKLLKVAFPVHILSSKAVYEIPFGSIERPTHTNTSWEQAQFEVCGHRWADLSEGGYGVALLNDCKYGYDIKGETMRLSLLRSPRWPDASADIGIHEFVYSICPHEGDWRAAKIVREGYQLNHPVQVQFTTSHEGELPSTSSLLQIDSEHAVLDSLKIAEDGAGIVMRIYESGGGREEVTICWPRRLGESEAFSCSLNETNLMEEPTGNTIPCEHTTSRFAIRPYEVVTFKHELNNE